jgi:fucose permease
LRTPLKANQTILIAYLTYVAFGIYDGLLGVTWPAMSQTLGVPLEALGILLMVGLAAFVLVSFNSGALIRTFSFYHVLLFSVLLRAVAFLCIALFPTWPMVILSVFAMSLGGGGIDTALNTWVSTHGSARQINWLHACFGVGATLGPFLAAGVLASGAFWAWNFVVVSIFLGLVSVFIWRTASKWNLKPATVAASNKPRVAARMLQSLRLPMIWISIVLFFMYTGTELTAGQWSFTLFHLGRGMPELAAKFWVGVYWGIFTLGRILFGLVADRVPLNAVLRYALLATTAGAALLWWNPAEWVALTGLVVMGLAESPVYPSLIANTVARVGLHHAPNAIGYQVAAGGVGGTLLPSLVGVLAAGIHLEVIAVSVLVLCVLTFIAYEIMLVMINRTRPVAVT